jgi:hypothetical protein
MIAYFHTKADDVVPLHKRGDCLVIKRAGLPITKKEREQFLIVDDWEDAEWQAYMDKHELDLVVAPYAHVKDDPLIPGKVDVALLSDRKVNVAVLPDAADVLDPTKEVAPKKSADLTLVNVQPPVGTTDAKTKEGAKK